MTNFLIRKTGNDLYGGTSPTLLATFTSSCSGTTVTATTSVFTPSHVGQAIKASSVLGPYIITGYISATQVTATVSGATWGSLTTYLGGAWASISSTTSNSSLLPSGSNVYIGAGVWATTAQLIGASGVNYYADT